MAFYILFSWECPLVFIKSVELNIKKASLEGQGSNMESWDLRTVGDRARKNPEGE